MSNVRYSFTVPGSGSVPYIMNQPGSGSVPEGILVARDGANSIVLNPEDFSAYRGGNTRQVSVSGMAVRLDNALIFRRSLAISNMSTGTDIFIGFTPTVTITTGYPVHAGREISIDMNNLLGLWSITAGSSVTVAILELS